jgi:nucleoside 2-deoxyribosyltransferase
MTRRIYLAGGLFNAGERLHNMNLEKHLKMLGYDVILPQREALKFKRGDNTFDIPGIVDDCRRFAVDPAVVLVGCIDGSDADSGTAAEYGMAMASTGKAIVYRTDLRTALDREVGVNAMLTAGGSELLLEPCFFTELDQVESFYAGLARKIDEAIKKLS